jgi:hypothetical protein
MIKEIRASWAGKSAVTKVVAIAAFGLAAYGVFSYAVAPRWAEWRAGMKAAGRANTEAARGLERAAGAAESAREDTAATLADYARTQEVVRALAKQSGELSRKAEDAAALARSKDATIAALQLALKQSGESRRAQAPVTTPQEAHDALAAIDSRFR